MMGSFIICTVLGSALVKSKIVFGGGHSSVENNHQDNNIIGYR